MKKEPLFIAFSTQKGGAGKTTLTVLMASYLYYVKGYDVAVVDCDYPQFSIKDMRDPACLYRLRRICRSHGQPLSAALERAYKAAA